MDDQDIKISELDDFIPAKLTFISSPPIIPPWEKKKDWTIWTPMLKEYHNIVDNPDRLPPPLRPLISKDRAFSFTQEGPSYINVKLDLPDEYGVHRRLFVTLCQENFIVGAMGALLVGIGTRHFRLPKSRLHSFLAQRLLLGKPLSAVSKMALEASILAVSLGSKVITRAVSGGVLYDTIVRSREERHMQPEKKFMNVGLAGGIVGFLFGLRGGLPQAWAAGTVTSLGSMATEFVTIPKHKLFSSREEGEA